MKKKRHSRDIGAFEAAIKTLFKLYRHFIENTFIEMAYMDELIVCENGDILPTA